MPFDYGSRLNNRQRIANAREKPIEANKNQSIDGAEGLFLRSGSPQNVYLLPQRQNFRLERCPRQKQIYDRPNNEPEKISHPATASPDSRSTASQIEFATGTVVMIPYFWLIDSGNAWAVWIGITALGGFIYSALAASQPAFFSELFPANVRYTGVAGAREFGAIAGGAIPLIATALSAAYASPTPAAFFVIGMCAVTLIAVMLAPETRGKVDATSS